MNDLSKILKEELGEEANKKLVEEVSSKLSSSWNLETNFPKSPVVLVVSGFQGAGKTTVLDILTSHINPIIISPDQIRHELFAKGMKFSFEFIHTVNATRNNLLKLALSTKLNIAIDQFMNPDRIKVLEKIIGENKEYRVIKILLLAKKKTLIQRVKSRKTLPGTYKGTVNELKASINEYKEIDISLYDKVLNTDEFNAMQIAHEIKKLLTSH